MCQFAAESYFKKVLRMVRLKKWNMNIAENIYKLV